MNKNLRYTLALFAMLTVILWACTPAGTASPAAVTLSPNDTPLPPAPESTILPTAPQTASKISLVDGGQEIGTGPASDIALGDVDNDGDLDAFVTYGSYLLPAPNKVYLNDGLGHFADSGQELGNKISYSVGLGDFNLDGRLDAFVANGDYDNGDGNEIWFNQGDGKFRLEQTIGNTNGTARIGDLNGDGSLDAFLCNHILSDGSHGGHRVFLNDGTGRFTDSGQILGGKQESRKCDLGDVDGDGDLDAVVGTLGGTEVWINDGTGHFTQDEQLLGEQEAKDVALGDLDGNGSLDAFIAYFRPPNRVWLNAVAKGKSHFAMTKQKLGDSGNSAGVRLGDLDGDGDLDAFVINSKWEVAAPNTVWENDGHGNFTDSGLRLGNDEGQEVALGDLDGDGRLDAFVVNRTTPSRIYFNRSGDGGPIN